MRLFEGTKWDRPPRCERCGELEEDCTCPPPPKVLTPPEKQTDRLAVEKRKRGKVVTVVQGLPTEENDLTALLGQLKAACVAGGTVKDDLLEIQGDHLDRVHDLLAAVGWLRAPDAVKAASCLAPHPVVNSLPKALIIPW